MEPIETTQTQSTDEQIEKPESETGVEPATKPPDEVPAEEPGPAAEAEPAEAGPAESEPAVAAGQLLPLEPETPADSSGGTQLKAVIEAIIYVTEEPLTSVQISVALGEPRDRIERILAELLAEYDRPDRGLTIREVAGGYKMATKPEHHEAVRAFVKKLKPPLKLSLAALETLAVVAYKQPVTAPEIMEIRGVQGAGVLKTLLDRKLIAAAGRKAVIGKPILYRTTKDFLVQFGLKDVSELPSLKEFEELRRLALADTEPDIETPPAPAPTETPVESSLPEADKTQDAPPENEPGT